MIQLATTNVRGWIFMIPFWLTIMVCFKLYLDLNSFQLVKPACIDFGTPVTHFWTIQSFTLLFGMWAEGHFRWVNAYMLVGEYLFSRWFYCGERRIWEAWFPFCCCNMELYYFGHSYFNAKLMENVELEFGDRLLCSFALGSGKNYWPKTRMCMVSVFIFIFYLH